MRPSGSARQLERRRRQAVRLLSTGRQKTLAAVARAVGSSVSSVFRWVSAYRKRGRRALVSRPAPGRPPKLSPAQKRRLVKLLLQGPRAAGYLAELWTVKRVTRLIKEQFRVMYHPGHVWRLLRQLGFSPQIPERRALQRDEREIGRWTRYTWPALKKRPTDSAQP